MLKSERILALDIGASQIVLAEFHTLKSGGLELINYGTGKLGVVPEEEPDVSAYIVATLREVMRSQSIKPGPVLLSISGQVVFPRYVALPPVAQDKIADIVRYEAQQNVPFPMDEVVWDYQLIGADTGNLSALIVAVKLEIVKNLTDCVEAAGLDPEIVDVSTMALYNAVRYNYGDADGCTMILDMGARTTNVIFAEGRRMFSRSVPVAGNAITKDLMKEFQLSFADAEELKLAHAYVGFGGAYDEGTGVAERVSKVVRTVMTRLHAEIGRTINFYRSQQGGSQPQRVLLTGGSSIIPHTDTFLRDKLKIDVDYLNAFRNVAVSERIDASVITKDVPLLGETVGLALRRMLTCPVELNLMPPDIVRRKVYARRIPFFALAAAGLVLTVLVWWLYFHKLLTMSRERIGSIEREVAALNQVDGRLAEVKRQKTEVMGKAEQYLGLIRGRTAWHELLDDIHAKVLDGMWLTSVRLVEKASEDATEAPSRRRRGGEQPAAAARVLEIRGQGFDDKVKQPDINGFAASLKGGRHFTDQVEITRMKPVDGTDYMTEFVIEIVMKDMP